MHVSADSEFLKTGFEWFVSITLNNIKVYNIKVYHSIVTNPSSEVKGFFASWQ